MVQNCKRYFSLPDTSCQTSYVIFFLYTGGILCFIELLDNMLCLLIFLQKRGFSLKLGKTNLTKALPKCKKETQDGNYNLCRNGCPQRQLFIMLL